MNLDLKLKFEEQCLCSGIWEYEGEYRSNSYPYAPKKKIVNFRKLDRDDYLISTIENKFIIYIVEPHGDTKIEIKQLYL